MLYVKVWEWFSTRGTRSAEVENAFLRGVPERLLFTNPYPKTEYLALQILFQLHRRVHATAICGVLYLKHNYGSLDLMKNKPTNGDLINGELFSAEFVGYFMMCFA